MSTNAMRAEHLVVYPTTDKSPFFCDPFTVDGLRGLLLIGPPRKGKTLNGNMLADHEGGGHQSAAPKVCGASRRG